MPRSLWGEYLCLQSLSGWLEGAKKKLLTPHGELGKLQSFLLGMPLPPHRGAFQAHISLCHSAIIPKAGSAATGEGEMVSNYKKGNLGWI